MEHEPALKHAAMADLTRLNAAEVRILNLLADGHTAKSIATLTGWSVASVNERLRHSRRKTGVSSSRELARLLRAQENGNKEIELASGATAEQKGFRVRTGVVVMSAMLLAAAIAAFTAQSSMEASKSASDPVIHGILGPPEAGAHHFARLVRTEQRDAEWADVLEATLKERFFTLVADGRIELISVKCARTACEVVGKIDERNREMVDQTMQKIQDHKFNAVKGAEHAAAAFGPKGFASYWKRS